MTRHRGLTCIFLLSALLILFDGVSRATSQVGQTPGLTRKSNKELLASIDHWQEPVYPAIAKAAGAGGQVTVEITVDTDGKVLTARAVLGHPLLQGPLVQAAKAWRFKPTLINNTPVKVVGLVSYHFPDAETRFNGKTLRELQRTVRRKPRSALARRELGKAYLKSDDLTAAVKELKLAVGLEPENSEGHRSLGHAYMRLFSYQDALAAFTTANKYGPGSSETLQSLGFAYGALGDHQKALKAFRASLETDEPIISSYFLVGKSYVVLHQPGEAIAYYQQGLAKHDCWEGRYGLGEALLDLGRYSEAVVEFKEALKFDGPGQAGIHYQLGLAFLKSGDKEGAMKEYESLKNVRNDLAEMLLEEIRRQTVEEGRRKGE